MILKRYWVSPSQHYYSWIFLHSWLLFRYRMKETHHESFDFFQKSCEDCKISKTTMNRCIDKEFEREYRSTMYFESAIVYKIAKSAWHRDCTFLESDRKVRIAQLPEEAENIESWEILFAWKDRLVCSSGDFFSFPDESYSQKRRIGVFFDIQSCPKPIELHYTVEVCTQKRSTCAEKI